MDAGELVLYLPASCLEISADEGDGPDRLELSISWEANLAGCNALLTQRTRHEPNSDWGHCSENPWRLGFSVLNRKMERTMGTGISSEAMVAVRRLAHLLDRDLDDEWGKDHVRWALYVRAAGHPDLFDDLRRAVELDPDEVMVSSVVVMIMERLQPDDRDSWIRILGPAMRAFPERRAAELTILEEIVAGTGEASRWSDPGTVAEWSDWLQLSVLAAGADARVRAVLAEHGRTKRIRRIAGEGSR